MMNYRNKMKIKNLKNINSNSIKKYFLKIKYHLPKKIFYNYDFNFHKLRIFNLKFNNDFGIAQGCIWYGPRWNLDNTGNHQFSVAFSVIFGIFTDTVGIPCIPQRSKKIYLIFFSIIETIFLVISSSIDEKDE